MATFRYYIEMPYGAWEYRKRRNMAATWDRNNSYCRTSCGSRTAAEVLSLLADKTVNAEYNDGHNQSNPVELRKQHLYPIPEFVIQSKTESPFDGVFCDTLMKKKLYIEGNKEWLMDIPGQMGTIPLDYKTFDMDPTLVYPFATDMWYEDYMNSTHDASGDFKPLEECQNSRLMKETGGELLSKLISNHGGHFSLVYPESTSVNEIPRPYVKWVETYSGYMIDIPEFRRVKFGQRMWFIPPSWKKNYMPYGDARYRTYDGLVKQLDSSDPAKDRYHYDIAFTAFNPKTGKYYEKCKDISSTYKSGGNPYKFRNCDFFKPDKVPGDITLENAIQYIYDFYKWYRIKIAPGSKPPDHETGDKYSFLKGVNVIIDTPTDEDRAIWERKKIMPCDLFIGDPDHDLEDVVRYICSTFELGCSYTFNGSTDTYDLHFKMHPNESSYKQTISFGENLLEYTNDMDVSEVVTAVVPFMTGYDDTVDDGRTFLVPNSHWHTTMVDEDPAHQYTDILGVPRSKYVFNKELTDKYGWVTTTLELDYKNYKYLESYCLDPIPRLASIRNTLTTVASEYLASQFTKAIESFDISAVDLAYLGGNVETLEVGDLVRCVSAPHHFDKVLPVTKIEIDLFNPANTKITLGKSLGRNYISRQVADKIDING